MIVNDPELSIKDLETMYDDSFNFDAGDKLSDSFSAGFDEGWAASPTASAASYFSRQGGEELTGAQANQKYNLVGTPAAFEDEEAVTENHAITAASRFFAQKSNEITAQAVERKYGNIGKLTNFAGSMAAGFVDPINLAVGAGASYATFKLGQVVTQQALKSALNPATVGGIFAKNIAENFVVTSGLEFGITPIGEESYNVEIPVEQKMMVIAGGTLFGGLIGGGVETAVTRQARAISHAQTKAFGTKSEELIEQSMTKNMMDYENGIKPNPDHPIKIAEYDYYATRPDQVKYQFVELQQEATIGLKNSNAIHDQTWAIGRDMKSGVLDQVEVHGNGTLVLVDNPNLVHNRVSGFKNSTENSAEIYRAKLNKNSKIMSSEDFLMNRAPIVRDVVDEIKRIAPPKNKKASRALSKKFDDAIDNDIRSVTQLKQMIHELVEDIELLPSVDDIVNKILRKRGFDGYHFVGTATTRDAKYNGIALFKREAFDGDKRKTFHIGNRKQQAIPRKLERPVGGKAKDVVDAQEGPDIKSGSVSPKQMETNLEKSGRLMGDPSPKTNLTKGFKESQFINDPEMASVVGAKGFAQSIKKGEGVFFDDRILSVYNAEANTLLDPSDIRANNYAKPMVEMEKAEIMRANDPTQKLGYSEDAVKELNQIRAAAKTDQDNPDLVTDFLDREAIEIEQLRRIKTLDKDVRRAMDIVDNPKQVDAAFEQYVGCRGFDV